MFLVLSQKYRRVIQSEAKNLLQKLYKGIINRPFTAFWVTSWLLDSLRSWVRHLAVRFLYLLSRVLTRPVNPS